MNNRFIEPVLTELSEPTNFFFEQTPELDAATGVIGHLRIDFGRNGKQFLHTWKQRGKAELNTPIFQEDLRQVMDMLRKDVLKDLKSMRQFCRENGGKIPGGQVQNYGYTITSDVYEYYLRCNPVNRGYQAYLTCFDLQEQRIDGNYQPLVGQVWFYGGEHLQYRTAEKYLEWNCRIGQQTVFGFRRSRVSLRCARQWMILCLTSTARETRAGKKIMN